MNEPVITGLSVVMFREDKRWVAQCLEYDIAAQAETVSDLPYEFEKALIAHVAVAAQLDKDPFEDMEAAPQEYWNYFREAKLRVEAERLPFRTPRPYIRELPHLKLYDKPVEHVAA